mmetsp:Transcript_14148/g.36171  ORF Transcript_14148/g.36171 Transcript_14148/m.36171 type:complete len:224 (-) Transcript_14148:29-700(-)
MRPMWNQCVHSAASQNHVFSKTSVLVVVSTWDVPGSCVYHMRPRSRQYAASASTPGSNSSSVAGMNNTETASSHSSSAKLRSTSAHSLNAGWLSRNGMCVSCCNSRCSADDSMVKAGTSSMRIGTSSDIRSITWRWSLTASEGVMELWRRKRRSVSSVRVCSRRNRMNCMMCPESTEMIMLPNSRPMMRTTVLKARSALLVATMSIGPGVICAMVQWNAATYW